MLARTLAAGLLVAALCGFDGYSLNDDCDSSGGVEQSFCRGFISGVAAMTNPKQVCIGNATVGQIEDGVVSYIRRHPEHRHLGASGLVRLGLSDAFPCPR
jgi:hypothetical protein